MMPFPGGIEDTSNGTLLFAVLLAIAYGWLVARPPSWRRTAVKTGSIALLALLAAVQGGPLLLIFALLMRRLWPAVGKALQLPVAVYALAILAMGMASLTTLLPLAILGAVLFMASDTLLAIGRFLLPTDSTHQGWVQPAVWALYFAAQLSIVLAFLA